jgi:hypothetical protein
VTVKSKQIVKRFLKPFQNGYSDEQHTDLSFVPGEREGERKFPGGDLLVVDKRARKNGFIGKDKSTFWAEGESKIATIIA